MYVCMYVCMYVDLHIGRMSRTLTTQGYRLDKTCKASDVGMALTGILMTRSASSIDHSSIDSDTVDYGTGVRLQSITNRRGAGFNGRTFWPRTHAWRWDRRWCGRECQMVRFWCAGRTARRNNNYR
jgi:hypothetical protein